MNQIRYILVLFVFILLAFACGSLLSYPVWKLLQPVSGIPLNKIVSQLTSLSGLAFIFLYLKFNKILNCETAGFKINQSEIPRDIIIGIFAGIFIMTILVAVLLLLGTHIAEPELNLTLKFIVIMLLKAIFVGFLVGLIEEILYRGALFGGLQKLTDIFTAIIISSLIYSAAHFIKYPELSSNANINWLSGFIITSMAFFRFDDPAILDSFLALFAFGVLLSLMRLNNSNIYQCIGVHAGVVMAIKIINDLTDYNPDNNFDFLINSYDHLLGYLAVIWLTFLIILYYKFLLKQSPAPSMES